MFELGDKVLIKDLGITGEISDINVKEGYCYVDVAEEDLNGNKPELAGCSFSRKLSDIESV